MSDKPVKEFFCRATVRRRIEDRIDIVIRTSEKLTSRQLENYAEQIAKEYGEFDLENPKTTVTSSLVKLEIIDDLQDDQEVFNFEP